VAVLVTAILVLGIGLRLRYMDEGALFIDEAESSLNALSILEHGYPADTYMGLPMFENTLTEPWPESAEYEFHDTSYSSTGKAIYHGWLPLYAIAASLALHGYGPDVPTDPPRVQHDDADIRGRIRAVRMPSLAFGGLFLAAAFFAGRALYGTDAGLSSMLAGALAPKCIWIAQQARYHSAALAITTLTAGSAWLVYRRGRWRDFLGTAVLFVLLFHTSSLAFGLLGIGCLALLPGARRHAQAPRKLAAAGALVCAGILPWMLWAGYFEQWGRNRMALELLPFPQGYCAYLYERPLRTVVGVLGIAAFAVLWRRRERLPARLRAPLGPAGMPVLFLCLWTLVAYAGFQALVPAASYSIGRLTYIVLPALLLLCGVGLAAVGRALVPARSSAVALAATLALMFGSGNAWSWQRRNWQEAVGAFQMVDHLRGLDIAPSTKLYALPNQHFCLTFYTGLPIQSIAPVRKSFLDGYGGEVLLLETVARIPPPSPARVQELAGKAGVTLTEPEARTLAAELQGLMIRAELQPLVREVLPTPEPAPAWAAPAMGRLLDETEHAQDIDFSLENPAIFGGRPALPRDEFWPAFFYRFVGAEERRGAGLNYAPRMRSAEAFLLPCNWAVLRSPAPGEAAQ
jgi:hypothetical protein